MSVTTLVIPCYNEARRLRLNAFASHLKTDRSTRFLFVDDGSTDETAAMLADFCRERGSQCRLLRLTRNGGKAEAVRQGMLSALFWSEGRLEEPARKAAAALVTAPGDGEGPAERAEGESPRANPPRGEYVGFWDADLATPLAALAEFREVLDHDKRIEWVFGSRIRLLGRAIERQPLRHYLGRGWATAVSLLLRLPVYDTQCGAKLFRANDELRSVLSDPFISRWVFDVELIARLICARRRWGGAPATAAIFESPLREWRDVEGSKVRPRDFWKGAVDLARIYRHYRRCLRGAVDHAKGQT
ncbi:MAG: glycosyltransferase [Pirellulales bacterium]|nr:glycosyltransferase [Pirellulales bacterium]